MATSTNQGFELEKNLSESVSDGSALDNLGGGNISSDISLFSNNTKNTSELTWNRNFDDSYILSNRFVFPKSILFIFTNGDEVKVTGDSLGSLNVNTTYYIVDYEEGLGSEQNQLGFGLSLTKGGSKVSLGTIGADVKFIRNDEVTLENILNIATPDIFSQGGELDTDDGFRYSIGASFDDAFNTINSNIDLFNFLRKEKYTLSNSVSTANNIIIEGTLSTDDPADDNSTQQDLDKANSPGLFVTDPFSPEGVLGIEKTRAFSTSKDPWTEGTGELVTLSEQVNIGNLFFDGNIKLNNFDGISVPANPGNATEFTHKLPVIINGVEYFVLLKQ